ncbi:MAG: C25 family cysteine peptidase [Niabella sp.]
MKRLLTILLLLFSTVVFAQQYNNEWIDYGKTYYKFKVGSTGLYRIPQSVLASAGLGNTNVAQFQLWRNGAEVPIYTSSQSGTLGSSGYIEFWGEMNDGKPDLPLYRKTDQQINDKYSLYTDTASYFLTINPVGGNKRFVATANTIPSGAVPEPYCLYTEGRYYKDAVHLGYPQGSGSEALYSGSYEYGEGWASNAIGNNATLAYNATNLYPYTGSSAPAAEINMTVVGDAINTRNVLLTMNGGEIFNNSLVDFNFLKLSKTVAASQLASGAANFVVTNSLTSTTIDRIKIGFIELKYPRLFNGGGSSNFRFQIPARATGSYLEISGFSFSGTPVIYDLNNGKRYEVNASNPSLLKVFLEPSSTVQDLVLVSQQASNIKSVTALETRSFVNYLQAQNQGDYLMITANALMGNVGGVQPVESYRAYRASAAGGGYNAKVYMVDQLIDQFGYGIKMHSLGVRNFIRWARSKFTNPVKYVFLVGKGISYYSALSYESTPDIAATNLVPTFGYPASDILLAAEGGSSVPLVSIGRLSVVNTTELTNYLNKVIEQEQVIAQHNGVINDNLWQKEIIHIIGASDEPTINSILGYLNQHKNIIEDTLYGAHVNHFALTSTGDGQISNTERVANLINHGIGMLTYFGHSSSVSMAFNLENPENYTNKGKYPFLNMMGCNVGNIFGYETGRLEKISTISEKYALAKDRGSVAMLAGTSLGYVSVLGAYNNMLYRNIAVSKYGGAIGDLVRQTVADLFQTSSENIALLLRSQCESQNLHGDPAVRLYQKPKPDYAIEDAMITINPSLISIAEPSFTVKAVLSNIGKAINRKVIVELKRTYPDLSTKVIKRDTLKLIKYQDSLTYTLPIDPLKDKGNNKITVTIDPDNLIDEMSESNNTVTRDVYIFEDEIRPVYPYEYAIINTPTVTFAASTANAFATSRNYVIEVDTTRLFNSSLKASQNKTSTGGVVEFTPSITFKDSTVYYWRVATIPASGESYKWNESSFTYIQGNSVGYGQGHHYQFDDNYYDSGINYDNKFTFSNKKVDVLVRSGIYPYGPNASDYSIRVDGDKWVQSGLYLMPQCENILRFYVLDKNTLKPWENQKNGVALYGSVDGTPLNSFTSLGFFHFDISTANGRKTVVNFLDSVPNGNIIAMTNSIYNSTVLPAVWRADTAVFGSGNSLYHKLEKMGLSQLSNVTSFVPFIFVFRKGDPVPLRQVVASMPEERLIESLVLECPVESGSFTSPVLGPSNKWKSLQWDKGTNHVNYKGASTFDVIGVNASGGEVTLFKNINILTQNQFDISSVNAKEYPNLRLKVNSVDTVNYIPYQFRNWRLLGDFVPEGALAPNIYFTAKDTLEIGEPLNLGIAFRNVSPISFDSLKVKLTIRNKNNIETIIPVPNQRALAAGDTIKLNVSVPTKSFEGVNQLFLEFNPEPGQPEQYHFNNFIYRDFHVKSDTISPYLDVTFDGSRILNRDIVSSKPEILITLTDDSKWQLLNDPGLVNIQLKYPDGTMRAFSYNSDTLSFEAPTSANENKAKINFKPYLQMDGVYQLFVTAKDQSGNNSSALQYSVSFQVINKPMISNMLNYPNPFTTSTAFVFTLTGSEVPQNIRIQILTITGKIVKEITKAELGNLRIGRNITEYKWDGTDQYGQKLANGVYLYRVLTNLNGKSLDKYTAEGDKTDKYFNKGYGKMYLMR